MGMGYAAMGRQTERLPPVSLKKIKKPGYHADGGGLYLQVTKSGARSWVFRYTIAGRQREMGLGGLDAVSLAEARGKAGACRKLRADGLDPIDERDRERREAEEAAARIKTFEECAAACIESRKPGWKNKKHRDQWTNTLKAYAYPTIGALSVGDVDTAHVTKILEPIWTTKTETASRVRGRIEIVLDYAKTMRWRTGENPARWRGHLDNILPQRSKVRKIKHHAALDYRQIGAFMAELAGREGSAALALRLTILTVARTNETIQARPEEIDVAGTVWTIPGDKMKGERDHRVPLSEAALAVIEEAKKLHIPGNPFLFPGRRRGRGLSNMAMLALLQDTMNRPDLTVHGFRSTFRDWAAEMTNFPREVAEMALAHAIDDKTEAAYRRGDLFRKRKQLMDAWARYCATVPKEGGSVAMLRPTA